jgi:hypothetical protein
MSKGANMAERASLDLRRAIPPDELAFVEGIAAGRPLNELARELGWDESKARRLARSSALLTAVATIGIERCHGILVPRALNVLEQILNGTLILHENGVSASPDAANCTSVQLIPVKPETRLAAVRTVLQMAGLDKPRDAEKPNDDKDLSAKTPDEIRAELHRLEAALADVAKDVSAPRSAPDGPSDDLPRDQNGNVISVLD